MKHHSAGPEPNHSMEKSATSLVNLSNYRLELKEQKAAKAADSIPTKLAPALQPVYNNFTQYCADNVIDNWERRKHLTVYRAAIGKSYVKEKVLKVPANNPKPRDDEEYLQYLKPRFVRTRIVEAIVIGGKLYLKCNCGEYEQCGYSCDAIFKVLDKIPCHQDIVIRWQKPYYILYLTGDKELDKRFDALFENQKPGPSLPCSSISDFRPDLAVGKCTSNHDLEYFEPTLPTRCPKIHPGCMWATTGPYAADQTSSVATTQPAAMKTVVTLSQAAQDSNDQYSEFLKGVVSADTGTSVTSTNNDKDFVIPHDDWDDDENNDDKVHQSMATYATKSPD